MMTQKVCTILVSLLFIFNWSYSQSPLPKSLTLEEQLLLDKGEYEPYSSNTLSPPPGPVRVPAEWEEMQGVIIVWEAFNSILAQITDVLKDEVEVIIVCPNINSTKAYLSNQNVDWSENVSFYELPSNSIWVRDYGPNSAYIEESGELVWIDWIYNRPRYLDDQVPQLLGEERGIAVYETATAPEDLVNTGGNFMSDGMGKGFSSNLVLEENGPGNQFGQSNHDEDAVDGIMDQYMGIEQYIKMEALPYDLIHHIDMHMKLIDEETILVGEYPEGVADGPQIEANIQYILDQFVSSYNRPFNIKRIPMPPGPSNNYPNFGDDYRTYANALFANKKIIVPTYEEEYDTVALRIWEELMPGYDVVGIDCNAIIPLSGALHCITKEVAAVNPITINMMTHPDWCSGEKINLEALVTAYEDLESVSLNYRFSDSDEWIKEDMTINTSSQYEYELESMSVGDELQYFVHVKTVSGKEITRPLPGDSGPRTTQIIDCSISSVSVLDLSKLEVFPNPSNAITCIAPNLSTKENVSIQIIDLQGQQVKELHHGPLLNSGKKFFIDAKQYAAGTYFVRIQSEESIQMEKLIIIGN